MDPSSHPVVAARRRYPLRDRNQLKGAKGLPEGIDKPIPFSSPLPLFADPGQENRLGLSLLLSPKNRKPVLKREGAIAGSPSAKARQGRLEEELRKRSAEKERAEALLKQQEGAIRSLTKKLEEMQEKAARASIDAARNEELLREKDEALKWKGREIENLLEQKRKLQWELKRVQKLKEFRPKLDLSFMEEQVEDKSKNKATSAYMLWRKDQWDKVKKENPDAGMSELCNILRKKWSKLNASEKQPYEERHQSDKESYLNGNQHKKNMDQAREEQCQKAAMDLLKQYLTFRKEADKENQKHRKGQDPSNPKQPLSAFFLFLDECRPALLAKNKNCFEIAKIAGAEWRSMSKEEQAPYREVAKILKDDYRQKLELCKQKNEETQSGELGSILQVCIKEERDI